MTVAVVLFTRDLRLTDNPVLTAAVSGADQVLPLFVVDPKIPHASPNRARFLAESLADLDASLRRAGARLVIRRGDPVAETARLVQEVGAEQVHIAADVSRYARRRQAALEARVPLHVHEETVTAVAPGRIETAAGGHYSVFTPYFRHWTSIRTRKPLPAPLSVSMPRVGAGKLPAAEEICAGETSKYLPGGGESEGRRRLRNWGNGPVGSYADQHDDLAGDNTSRLSPYLHLGCVSAAEVVARSPQGSDGFIRQLAWRDFYHQVLAARPDAASADYRSRNDHWRRAPKDLQSWQDGRTGYPVVDAGMRQLRREGFMHNRARLITASFLTKTLYIDWRAGARHFMTWLVDGDLVNNQLNWQWVAGTGNDTRPQRVLNPLRQAERFDPEGDYVRRYVPELRGIKGSAVHQPWDLPEDVRSEVDYPDRIVDLREGLQRFRAAH